MATVKTPVTMDIKAIVTRADGTVEDLGVISSRKLTLWERIKLKSAGIVKEN